MAKFMLEDILNVNFVKSERPDLQCNDIGVEVTSAHETWFHIVESDYLKIRTEELIGNHAIVVKLCSEFNDKYSKRNTYFGSYYWSSNIKFIAGYAIQYLSTYGDLYTPRKNLILDRFRQKLESINKFEYSVFNNMSLFMFSLISFGDLYKEKDLSRLLISTQKDELSKNSKWKNSFDFVYIYSEVQGLLLCVDMRKECMRSVVIDSNKYSNKLDKLSRG